MRQPAHLSVVREGDRPPPLIPTDVIIKDYPEALMPQDIFSSDWWITAGPEERLYGFTLNLKSYTQKPTGSLPSDDRLLARIAECDVQAFRAVREKVLEGWELCSDGRYYRRSIAIKVLAFWISRLFKRRSSAAGNAAQDRDVPDQDEFSRPIFQAEDALARLDATHKQVRKCRAHRTKLARQNEKVTEAAGTASNENNDLASPVGTPSGTPNRSPKVSQAKRRQRNTSSGFHPEDSGQFDFPENEHADGGRSEERTELTQPVETPVPPWPPDCEAQLKARYPRVDRWPGAEKELRRLRKAGKVSFEAIMAGVAQLVATNPDPYYVPRAANWLRDRGWEDTPVRAPRGPPERAQPPRFRNGILSYLAKEGIIE